MTIGDYVAYQVAIPENRIIEASQLLYHEDALKQDLSGWCVLIILFQPLRFDEGADNWSLPRPDWGAPCN